MVLPIMQRSSRVSIILLSSLYFRSASKLRIISIKNKAIIVHLVLLTVHIISTSLSTSHPSTTSILSHYLLCLWYSLVKEMLSRRAFLRIQSLLILNSRRVLVESYFWLLLAIVSFMLVSCFSGFLG